MNSRDAGSGAIATVAIVGSGTMGAQIGSLAAFAGRTVRIYDALPEALHRAKGRIKDDILPAIAAGRHLDGDIESVLARVTFVERLDDAVDGVDLVIEAVKEDIDVKRSVFAELSRLAPNAILATNSSSIPSSRVADVVEHPERLLNMHFFAPIWVRTMLELMSCGHTSDEVLQRTFAFGQSLGLVTAIVRGESMGFIINRIWRAVKRESLRVVDEGVANPEDIDRLWMLFFQTKYAPFGIMDMVGLDVVRDIEWSYQRETLDPTDLPSTRLREMIEAGKLGEKSGEGFYTHPNPAYAQPGFLNGIDED
jgi:3-hydroxybutyryl-CoA dehydrogenase